MTVLSDPFAARKRKCEDKGGNAAFADFRQIGAGRGFVTLKSCPGNAVSARRKFLIACLVPRFFDVPN
jgi:hypothetical protein